MELENIVLLGFVDSAVKYLDQEFKYDGQPPYLKDFNIVELCNIRDDLNKRISSSLGTYTETVSKLVKTGNDAFDKFIDDRKNNYTLLDEISDIFDEALDDGYHKEEYLGITDLRELLSYYNIKDDLNPEVPVTKEEDKSIPLFEETKIETTSEDDAIFEQISKAKDLLDDENHEEEKHEDYEDLDKEIDNILAGVLVDEDKKDEDLEIDDIFNEIINKDEDENIFFNEEEEKHEDDIYVSSLINDLKAQLLKEEEEKEKQLAKRNEIYMQINKMYPYLSQAFIRSVYDMKDSIAIEYPRENVVILHRLVFETLDELQQFVEIVLGHDYNVNVDESRKIVDVFKEHYNTDGKIITNIFEIANQAKLLNGNYEGYHVIVENGQ